ncbi:hypothetical protein FA13DRAFT_1911312 [Coprinellus micaceus]|uniref:Uncharacterized protein n=1 Tax=Coprinellus micaceus TaxID=71717 RepID=A0A4Y7TNZ0_COPMI|nr:hypothetical protein FA13DRAFT_1911312 [Coprinellus micaceus]
MGVPGLVQLGIETQFLSRSEYEARLNRIRAGVCMRRACAHILRPNVIIISWVHHHREGEAWGVLTVPGAQSARLNQPHPCTLSTSFLEDPSEDHWIAGLVLSSSSWSSSYSQAPLFAHRSLGGVALNGSGWRRLDFDGDGLRLHGGFIGNRKRSCGTEEISDGLSVLGIVIVIPL